jgi:DMSO/TMAO reductase YedYZ molybdopterin-dependent catalytic subunit
MVCSRVMRCLAYGLFGIAMIGACSTSPAGTTPPSNAGTGPEPSRPAPSRTPGSLAGILGSANPCGLPPVVAPTPAPDPGYTQLDPTTGLHMTGTMKLIDLATYRLLVMGLVDRPLELTYEQIRCLPKMEASPLLVCPGFFEDQASWAGTSIANVLELAGVQFDATSLTVVGADGYSFSLSLQQGLNPSNLLAWEWEGEPLPRLHGFPVRLVIPGEQGNQWVKWVVEINVR